MWKLIKQRTTKPMVMIIMILMVTRQKINVIKFEAKSSLEKLSRTNLDATGSCIVLTRFIVSVAVQSAAAKTSFSKRPRAS